MMPANYGSLSQDHQLLKVGDGTNPTARKTVRIKRVDKSNRLMFLGVRVSTTACARTRPRPRPRNGRLMYTSHNHANVARSVSTRAYPHKAPALS
jgi:hypothetical protein